MNMYRYGVAGRFCSAASAVLIFLMLSSTSFASDVRHLWQSRDQFVALERQSAGFAEPAQANDHPVELQLDRLIAILSSIEIRATAGGKPEPLFTGPALQVLAPHLQQALRQATPGEDVTFAIIGLHNALFGLAKSPKVTTGRVFYQSGRLNIIFGLVQVDVRDRDDRRLFPFTPGSREKAREGEWVLLVQSGQHGYSQIRKDWLTFSDEWQASVATKPVPEQSGASLQPPSVPAGKREIDTRSPAERLIRLNELKNKGLINEEEYRSKRLEILNGL